MTKKLVVFAGHYDDLFDETGSKGIYTNTEADGQYEEFDSNIVIARETVRLMRKVDGVKVYFPQENGADYRSLQSRVDYCNDRDVDLAIFIHSNAGPSSAKGACSFYYYTNDATKKLSEYYASEMKKAGYPLWSGGTYGCNPNDGWSFFYVIKKTKMNAILTENFFFTNARELKEYLQDPTDLMKLGEIHAKTACHELKVKFPAEKVVIEKVESLKDKRLDIVYDGKDGVDFYSKATWDKSYKVDAATKGFAEVVAKYHVEEGSDKGDMYEVIGESGKKYFITAHEKFVKLADAPKDEPKEETKEQAPKEEPKYEAGEKPKEQKSVRFRTGGLSKEARVEVMEYFHGKDWWGEVKVPGEKAPYLVSGYMNAEKQAEFKAWMDERGWWYEILE